MTTIDDQVEGIDPRDPVVVALGAAAATPVAVGADRLTSIEERIRTSMRDDLQGDASRTVVVPSMWRRSRRSLLAAAAIVLLVTFGVVAVLLADDDSALAIAAADRVVVEFPGGESVPGAVGTELPDGTRLEVVGFVEVDGRRFGPGSYRIVDGAVVATSQEIDSLDDSDDPAPDRRPAEEPRSGGDVAPTTDSARSSDDPDGDATTGGEPPGAGSGADGSQDEGRSDPVVDRPPADPEPVEPDPTRPPPTQPPRDDDNRRPAPTVAPSRPSTLPPSRPTTTTAPARPTTTVARPTTTARTTTTTTTTSTTTTTVPARTTIPER